MTDICELFEDEVDHAFEEAWTSTDGFDTRATDTIRSTMATTVANCLRHDLEASVPERRLRRAPASRQFKTLWFDDDLDGDLHGREDRATRPTSEPTEPGPEGS